MNTSRDSRIPLKSRLVSFRFGYLSVTRHNQVFVYPVSAFASLMPGWNEHDSIRSHLSISYKTQADISSASPSYLQMHSAFQMSWPAECFFTCDIGLLEVVIIRLCCVIAHKMRDCDHFSKSLNIWPRQLHSEAQTRYHQHQRLARYP